MIFATDLHDPEGPYVLPDRSWLVVEMAPGWGCVSHISVDGKKKDVLVRTGRPNGLVVDRVGTLWIAESLGKALLRMTMDGKYDRWVETCEGVPFLFPNDLAFGPDGMLYLTDSGVDVNLFLPGNVLRPDYDALKYDGRVYQIDLNTRQAYLIDSGIQFTNGIAFGPDNYLYVNETRTGNVYRYNWKDGRLGRKQLFGNVVDPEAPPGWKGPDGMKFGADGNLYVTVYGQGDVTVLDRKGEVVKRIKTSGSKPTNLAFGPPGEKKIYVTEVEKGILEVLEIDTTGMPLYTG